MRLAAALIAVLVTIGAAQAAGQPRAVSPAQKATSGDGRVVVEVPRGALAKNVRVRVRLLTRAQYPAELRRAASLGPGARLYALEPAGTTFLKPVTITNRIDAKAQGFDLAAVPGVVLTTRSGNGRWALLGSQTIRPAEPNLLVSGTLRRFSTLVAFDSGARYSLVPNYTQTQVGSTWRVEVSVDPGRGAGRDRVTLRSVTWATDGQVVTVQRPEGRAAVLSCARAGSSRVNATVLAAANSLPVAVGSLTRQRYTQTLHLAGLGECKAPAARP
jgi:hypothetical protein